MLIGLNGKAGAGKDTVADYLATKKFKRYAFADAVRDVALAIDPIVLKITDPGPDNFETQITRLSKVVADIGWDRAKRELIEVRRLLQVIGTEAGRQVLGEDVWVNLLQNTWYDDKTPDGVITDMRFSNEFAWVSAEHDGVTIKIVRPNNPDAIASTHASEQYDPPCDYTIINDGSLEKLYDEVDHILQLVALEIGG